MPARLRITMARLSKGRLTSIRNWQRVMRNEQEITETRQKNGESRQRSCASQQLQTLKKTLPDWKSGQKMLRVMQLEK